MAYFHGGDNFDFNNYNMQPREPFQWQLPSNTSPSIYNGPSTPRHDYTDLNDYAELNDELRLDEQRTFHNTMADSTHTVFQEQSEASGAPLDGVDEYDPPPTLGHGGYMHSSSPFLLEAAPTNEQSFLECYPKGKATVTYPGDDAELQSIGGVNAWMIEKRCPLLAIALEESRSGPQLHLEALTQATAWPFLRYLYTGSYALATASGDYFEDVPTSVLLHANLYRLADIYDLPDLKSQAYVNVLRQCEFGCSSPNKPIDLCATIRVIYEHLSQHAQLVDAIVNYCVSCFQRHRLGEDEGFKDLAYTLRPFHQGLCRNSMGREFENETAAAIIQLPFRPYTPEGYASREEPGHQYEDVVYHFHSGDSAELSPKKRKHGDIVPTSRKSALTLALPQKSRESEVVPEDADAAGGEPESLQESTVALDAAESDLEPMVPSDEDYDIVARPEAVEVLSTDDESDFDTTAATTHQATPIARSLPIRGGAAVASSGLAVSTDSDSDSDWTVV